jgi:hypothetical protein
VPTAIAAQLFRALTYVTHWLPPLAAQLPSDSASAASLVAATAMPDTLLCNEYDRATYASAAWAGVAAPIAPITIAEVATNSVVGLVTVMDSPRCRRDPFTDASRAGGIAERDPCPLLNELAANSRRRRSGAEMPRGWA